MRNKAKEAAQAAARRQVCSDKAKRKRKRSATSSSTTTAEPATASTNGQRSVPAAKNTTAIIRNPYAKKAKATADPPSPVSESEDDVASLSAASLSSASEVCPSESDSEESEYEFMADDSPKRLDAPTTSPSCSPSDVANPSTKSNPSTASFLPDFDYTPTAGAVIPHLVSNREDGTIDFSTIDLTPKETVATTDPSGFSLAGILQSIHENPIRVGPDAVQVAIDNLSGNTPQHEKKLLTVEKEFFETLANHETARGLAEKIPDPEDPSTMKFRLYIECRAPVAPKKHFLLNWALMIYSVSHRKKKYRGMDLSKNTALFAEAQYEPNTVDLFFKCLFSRFHSESISYKLSRDFNGKGMCYRVLLPICWGHTTLTLSLCSFLLLLLLLLFRSTHGVLEVYL